jgi:hypothetical protein
MLLFATLLPAVAWADERDAAAEWDEIVKRSQAADAERAGRPAEPQVVETAPAATPAKTPGAHAVAGHAGDAARKYNTTTARPVVITPAGEGQTTAEPRPPAPTMAGPGVEIISGGGSADGAARVGRLPIMQ